VTEDRNEAAHACFGIARAVSQVIN